MANESNTAEEYETFLAEIAEEQNFHEYTIEKGEGSMKGDGYVGIITAIKISGRNKNNEYKILNLVVKSASKSDALRTELPVATAFEREIYMYETVFPLFQTFEIEKGLQPSYFAPKLYKTHTANKSEAIVLENLKEGGYRLHERKIPMNDDHVSLVMTQYGRLHALSFALRDQNPDKFETFVGYLDDILCKFLKETLLISLTHRCSKALESLDANTEQSTVKHFQKFIDGMVPLLDELRDSADDYAVVLHGDCWTNNMMFKYEDSNNTTNPSEVRFLDFQVSKVGLPVLDLAYFFYACSSKEVINNLGYYMGVYYNSLSTHLRQLGSDPDKMFPYSILQQQWKKYAKFGLLISTLTIHAILSEQDEIIDLKDMAETENNVVNAFTYDIANADEYNDRMRHIILHFEENNFF